MKAARVCELLFYVGIPYFPGQSPGKYFRRSRAYLLCSVWEQVDPHANQHRLQKRNLIEIRFLCVGTTYFPGQSPDKYLRRM